VILSSTPIPETGNDALIGEMIDSMLRRGVHVITHVNHDLDGYGPLHVSGHASIDEYADIIRLFKPKFFMPIYGAYRSKQRHIDIAVNEGIPRKDCINAENGQMIAFTEDTMESLGEVPHGTILVDQSGSIVNNMVIKDRVMLAEEGLIAVVLTIDKKSGNLLTSPDIISRGFIYMRENEDLINGLRTELRRAAQQRYKRIDLDRFKTELKEHVMHYLYQHTNRSPIVIPVVNVIGGSGSGRASGGESRGRGGRTGDDRNTAPVERQRQPEEQVTPEQLEDQQKRFAEMRAKLLGQDARTD